MTDKQKIYYLTLVLNSIALKADVLAVDNSDRKWGFEELMKMAENAIEKVSE